MNSLNPLLIDTELLIDNFSKFFSNLYINIFLSEFDLEFIDL